MYGHHGNAAVAAAAARPDEAAVSSPGLLFSFEGSATSRLRRRLFALDVDPAEAVVRDSTRAYDHFDHDAPGREAGQQEYARTMLDSLFVLCPRGAGTGTLRLFEAMSVGRAPVVISDRYVLPRDPEWESCACLRCANATLGDVAAILRAERPHAAGYGMAARQVWERWFAPEVLFDQIVDAAAAALAADRRSRRLFHGLRPLMILALWVRLDLRRALFGAAVRVRRTWRAQRRRARRSRHPA